MVRRHSRRRALRTTATVASLVATLSILPAASGAAADDPLLAQQWALEQISAPDAWAVSTGAGVTIGVVDTGIDLGHEDLAAKVAASATCLDTSETPGGCAGNGQDDNGHGTHVSGIAAAVTGNGRGMAGVAPDARLVVAKVLDADGAGTGRDVAAGIRWVLDRGARVVNLSLGDVLPVTILSSTVFRQAVQEAWDRGAVPVLAAGNSTAATSADYAGLDVVVVAATAPNDERPYYSSSVGNAKWGVAAPGGEGNPVAGGVELDVVSTWWTSGRTNRYSTAAGTSMAAPHVSGVLALLLARGLSPAAAVDRLVATADPVSCGTNCRGRVNAARAVAGLGPQASPTTTAQRATTPTTAAPNPPTTTTTSGTSPPTTTATSGTSPPTTHTTASTTSGSASPPPAAPPPTDGTAGGSGGGTAAAPPAGRPRAGRAQGPPAGEPASPGAASARDAAAATGDGVPEVVEAPAGGLRSDGEAAGETDPASSSDGAAVVPVLLGVLAAAALGGLVARRATRRR